MEDSPNYRKELQQLLSTDIIRMSLVSEYDLITLRETCRSGIAGRKRTWLSTMVSTADLVIPARSSTGFEFRRRGQSLRHAIKEPPIS